MNTKNIPPTLARMIQTNILLAIRDGINPRASLFLRDAMGDFQNLQALKSARINIASILSPVRDPQVIGIYAKIYDNPISPYNIEVLQAPFRPRGDQIRMIYEFLCIQDEIDLVIIDRRDNVLFKKRLPIPHNMKINNTKIFNMMELSEGKDISNIQLNNAVMRHTQQFNLSDVQY